MRNMRNDTEVQLLGWPGADKAWGDVAGPTEIPDDFVERLSLDVGVKDFDFLERLAAYRNALAAAQDIKLKRRWSRKSQAESFIAIQCDVMRMQLSEMIAECGDLPPADDREAVEKYARKVVAWSKRQEKSDKDDKK
jgi:hypothetical protein